MANKIKSIKTPIASVRRQDASKSGVHHWWHQRLTAITMVPVVLAALYLIFRIGDSNYNQAIILIKNPFHAAILSLLIVTGFWHSMLGVQVIIEDYVSSESSRMVIILLIKGVLILLATLSALSLIIILSK